jgi:SulP family sulfate permease
MSVTVLVVVATHDLAQGVFVGVLLSSLLFAKKVSNYFSVKSELSDNNTHRTYYVYGEVFFASAPFFNKSFDFKEVVKKVTIDLNEAHFWDLTAVSTLDKIMNKFKREGTDVVIKGLNEASKTIIDRLSTYDSETGIIKAEH